MRTNKINKNDKVAILSPSSPAAGFFPWVFEQGLERLRSIFHLEPQIMPNCLNKKASQEDKANDLHEAFSNPEIKAVISCTGGNNQIELIKYLKAPVFRENPKPFFGYSDNTHLCNFLYANGVSSFYGGSLLSQFAMQAQMCPETIESLKWALFENIEWFEIKAPPYYIDEDHPWDNKSYLSTPRIRLPHSGHIFIGEQIVEGKLWGGCLESLSDLLRIHNRVPNNFTDLILFLETSEEIPNHEFVRRFMTSLGEAGILASIRGLIVGRPKTWFFDKKMSLVERHDHYEKQFETISSVTKKYNPKIPMVFNISFGHTDPQLVIPYGGKIKINGLQKSVKVQIA